MRPVLQKCWRLVTDMLLHAVMFSANSNRRAPYYSGSGLSPRLIPAWEHAWQSAVATLLSAEAVDGTGGLCQSRATGQLS